MKFSYFVFIGVLMVAIMNFGCVQPPRSLWESVPLNDRLVASHCQISENNQFFTTETLAQRIIDTDVSLRIMLFRSYGCDDTVIYSSYTLARLEEDSNSNRIISNNEIFCYETNTNTNDNYHINCAETLESCQQDLYAQIQQEGVIFYTCRAFTQIQNSPNEREIYQIQH